MSLKDRAFSSRWSSGSRTSSRVMSAFWTLRSAILPSIFVAVNPGVPFSRTNPRISSLSTSRAHTTMRSAKVPLPIQRFFPLSTQWSPSRRAVVASPPAMSEPWSGSVSANAPIEVRSAMPGSQRSRCSAEPQW